MAFSPVVRIGSAHPLSHRRVLPPPLVPGGGEGVGGPNSDEGTNTGVLYVQYNPSTRVMKKSLIVHLKMIIFFRSLEKCIFSNKFAKLS
jgi:hypothetical protein